MTGPVTDVSRPSSVSCTGRGGIRVPRAVTASGRALQRPESRRRRKDGRTRSLVLTLPTCTPDIVRWIYTVGRTET